MFVYKRESGCLSALRALVHITPVDSFFAFHARQIKTNKQLHFSRQVLDSFDKLHAGAVV